MKICGDLDFAHIKQENSNARVVKCVFVSYLESMKGYKIWKMDLGGSKLIIRREVNFDETHMGMKFTYLEVKEIKNHDEEKFV